MGKPDHGQISVLESNFKFYWKGYAHWAYLGVMGNRARFERVW